MGGKFVTQTRAGQPTRVDPGILEEYFLCDQCTKFDASKNTLELFFDVFDDKKVDKSDIDQVKGTKNTDKQDDALEMEERIPEEPKGKLVTEKEVTATITGHRFTLVPDKMLYLLKAPLRDQ